MYSKNGKLLKSSSMACFLLMAACVTFELVVVAETGSEVLVLVFVTLCFLFCLNFF